MDLEDSATPLFDFDSAAAPATSLSDDLEQALQEHFGLGGFRAGQQQVIERVMQHRSTLALMPTGAGKSLCYQLPALLLPHATVVISPLIALMKDQIDGLPPTVRERSTLINSSLDFATIRARLRDLAAGRYKLVYVAPERLRQRQFLHALQQVGISQFVVDEAHCVSLWGLSFRPDYLFLREAMAALGNPPILALTATASPLTEREIRQQLGDLEVVRTNVFRPNLILEVVKTGNHSVRQALAEELCCSTLGSIIVYVRSKAGCDGLAARLRELGLEAEAYHAGCPNRDAIQDRFMRGETRIIAATIAFGMGVDKPDVRAVIHLNLSKSLDDYAQEAGRAGRDGLPARCVLLYAPSDKGQLSVWMQEEAFSIEELRDVYGALRRFRGPDQQLSAPPAFLAEASGLEETRLRVALGMLERAQLLRRHFDAPRVLKLCRGQQPPDAECTALIEQLGISGYPSEWSLEGIADTLQQPLSAVEPLLLAGMEAGMLEYEGFQREMVLEFLPPPADSRERMAALLREYRVAQERRLEALSDYARTKTTCRHRMMAAHFGQRLQPCGDACDICQRGRATSAPRINTLQAPLSQPLAWGQRPLVEHHQVILEAVRTQQGLLSSRDLAHILTGSRGYGDHALFGRLSNRSFDSVRAEIDVLVEAGHLAYRGALLVATEREQGQAREPALAVLRTLTRLPFGLGRTGLARLLKGASNSPVTPERSPDWGLLSSLGANQIEAIIEALIESGLITRDPHDPLRLLRLAAAGQAALTNPGALPPLPLSGPPSSDGAVADQELLERLKEWRAEQASSQGVPRYVIFPDTVLYDLAALQPASLDELSQIKGIGPQKLERWGSMLMEIITGQPAA